MYIDFLTAPDELEPTEACTIDIMTPVSSSVREESLCNDACLYPADNTPEVHSTEPSLVVHAHVFKYLHREMFCGKDALAFLVHFLSYSLYCLFACVKA